MPTALDFLSEKTNSKSEFLDNSDTFKLLICSSSKESSLRPLFSMTMCNQVLEHIFNPQLAFKNLCQQTAPSGYIYVSIPTLNCIHGEPDFFSSGFYPRFLEYLAIENKLEILNMYF